MATSTDSIVEGFPHPIIPPIIGIPSYTTISTLNLKLNANAASIQSDLGNGALGLLSLTVSPDVFNTLSDIPFIAPLNPSQKVAGTYLDMQVESGGKMCSLCLFV
jgi:hypothetical protein